MIIFIQKVAKSAVFSHSSSVGMDFIVERRASVAALSRAVYDGLVFIPFRSRQ
jgi:hypothetical protein